LQGESSRKEISQKDQESCEGRHLETFRDEQLDCPFSSKWD
jgi:hypothetical protein